MKNYNLLSKKGNIQVVAVLVLMVAVLITGYALVSGSTNPSPKAAAPTQNTTTGNGGPGGAHYQINVIGVKQGKTANFNDDTDGRSLFVWADGTKCTIKLVEGAFKIIDRNCTDDGVATFSLPNPDPTNSGTSTYSVYSRSLGTPKTGATADTCATDPTTGTTWCSVYQMVTTRGTGGSKFTNVTKQLLYLYADINGDGTLERYPLFDATLQNYFWGWTSIGQSKTQLRFYYVPTIVP